MTLKYIYLVNIDVPNNTALAEMTHDQIVIVKYFLDIISIDKLYTFV